MTQITLAAFQLRSFGIFPFGENKIITASQTVTTASGGDPNDFNSVKLVLSRVSKADCAAKSAGSAFRKSSSHNLACPETFSSIILTFRSSSAAIDLKINSKT